MVIKVDRRKREQRTQREKPERYAYLIFNKGDKKTDQKNMTFQKMVLAKLNPAGKQNQILTYNLVQKFIKMKQKPYLKPETENPRKHREYS